jgi:hypothetical protein
MMGFEYNFRVTPQDVESLSRNPDGIDDLDKLLRAAPHFIEARDSTYIYDDASETESIWPTTISRDGDVLCVCIYDRSPGSRPREIMDYLVYELLGRCGHVEIEDA